MKTERYLIKRVEEIFDKCQNQNALVDEVKKTETIRNLQSFNLEDYNLKLMEFLVLVLKNTNDCSKSYTGGIYILSSYSSQNFQKV